MRQPGKYSVQFLGFQAGDLANKGLVDLPPTPKLEFEIRPLPPQPLKPSYDPTDKRVIALVSYFARHGFRLVSDAQNYWKLTEPNLGDNVKVSILSFPENATPRQMAGALGVIQLNHELNPAARLAMATPRIGEKTDQLKELFRRYEPATSDKAL